MSDNTVTIEYPEAVYALFETSLDNLPAVVVVNEALKEFAHPDVFPWHLSVIIEAVDLAELGMPTRGEYQILDAIDQVIDDAVLTSRNGIFFARQTWNGQRQLLYRVNDPEVAAQALQALIDRGGQQREWEFEMVKDPDWEHAAPYLSLFETADQPRLD